MAGQESPYEVNERFANLCVLIAVEHFVPNVRVEFRADIVCAVEKQAAPPVSEHLARIAVSCRIVGRGNSALEQLAQNLWRIERQSTGIFLRNQRTRSGVIDPRHDRSMLFPNVSRIGFKQMRKESIDKKTRSDLIRFRRPVSLRIGTPALAIMGLRIHRLLHGRLQYVA